VGTSNPWSNLNVQITYLTPQEYDNKISAKNSVGGMSFPRFITPAIAATTAWKRNTPVLYNNRVQSQNIQINNIPDYFIVYVREPLSSQNSATSNYFLPVDNVSITFNNKSGILSNATQQQLFQISKKNGSGQNFSEFQGYALNPYTGTNSYTTAPTINSGGIPSVGYGAYVPTVGSLLVFNPSYDFGLGGGLLVNGSQGNFNFSISVNTGNQQSYSFTPELVILTIQSNVITTINGVTQVNSGIMTQSLVAKALESREHITPLDEKEYARMIGSGHALESKLIVHKLKKHHMGKPHHKMLGIKHDEMSGSGEGFGRKKMSSLIR
jgi:hypothetical protein